MDGFWNFLTTTGITATQLGLLKEIYVLLLLLPIVATIVSIARYIIGARSLSIYTPIILTFLFFEFGRNLGSGQDVVKGLKYGFLFFFLILFASALFYKLIRGFRLNYLPKLTIALILVSIIVFVTIIILALVGEKGVILLDQFTLIVFVSLTESFISIMARKSIRYGVSTAIQTLVISIFSYLLVAQQGLQNILTQQPWIIILIIIANIYIGRFTGLRLSEYWRFRSILFKQQNKIDDKSGRNTAK